ncbi:MAG TPA: hypothetical protein GX404_09200 [Syntrophomonadaceae bacterium]|nr:hypothetical protein [Syntrophomonadaceae bacterium]
MKRGIALGLLVGILFALFVMVKDLIGVNAFYMAAVAVAMFAVLGPFGDYFKAGLSMLIGVVVGLAGILILLVATPLPPENLVYVALVSGVSLFLMVLVSTTGLRIDAMFLGWAGYFAAVWGQYMADPTVLATTAIPAAVGVTASLLLGLVIAILTIRIAMAVNR